MEHRREWIRLRSIGRGSTAVVSLAAATSSGELFAVKSSETSGSVSLQREQQILASLDCPNIVSYLGHDAGAACFNLFMEYAPGGSISDEIRRRGGKLEEGEFRSFAREILAGLSYLHARRIAHCDIKGRNVLISAGGTAKIADLGCARAFDEEDLIGGAVKGTPAFMAPEVARGEDQGPEADIWALGCTVIEMATGAAPWSCCGGGDETALAALHRIAFSDDVPEVPWWISDEGRDFLGACLARDPKARWTADQLLEHPFVSKCEPSDSNPVASEKRGSPKSTLDWGIWDSMTEESDEEEEEEEELEESLAPAADPALRIGELCFPCAADWTIDGGDWITVRSIEETSGDEESAAAAVNSGEDDSASTVVVDGEVPDISLVGSTAESPASAAATVVDGGGDDEDEDLESEDYRGGEEHNLRRNMEFESLTVEEILYSLNGSPVFSKCKETLSSF